MKKINNLYFIAFAAFALLIVGVSNIVAQESQPSEEIADRVGTLVKENMDMYSELSEMIAEESLMTSSQPFPLELREEVDASIQNFLSHSDRLLAFSEELSRRYSNTNCRNSLENIAEPALISAKAEYSETRQAAEHSADRDMQLANLLGYQLLSAVSFVNLHHVRQTLVICGRREMAGF